MITTFISSKNEIWEDHSTRSNVDLNLNLHRKRWFSLPLQFNFVANSPENEAEQNAGFYNQRKCQLCETIKTRYVPA